MFAEYNLSDLPIFDFTRTVLTHDSGSICILGLLQTHRTYFPDHMINLVLKLTLRLIFYPRKLYKRSTIVRTVRYDDVRNLCYNHFALNSRHFTHLFLTAKSQWFLTKDQIFRLNIFVDVCVNCERIFLNENSLKFRTIFSSYNKMKTNNINE